MYFHQIGRVEFIRDTFLSTLYVIKSKTRGVSILHGAFSDPVRPDGLSGVESTEFSKKIGSRAAGIPWPRGRPRRIVDASAHRKNRATLAKLRVAFCGGVSSFVDRPAFSRLIVHRQAGECQLAAIFYPRFQQVQPPFFLRHEFQRVRGTRWWWRHSPPAAARIPRPIFISAAWKRIHAERVSHRRDLVLASWIIILSNSRVKFALPRIKRNSPFLANFPTVDVSLQICSLDNLPLRQESIIRWKAVTPEIIPKLTTRVEMSISRWLAQLCDMMAFLLHFCLTHYSLFSALQIDPFADHIQLRGL